MAIISLIKIDRKISNIGLDEDFRLRYLVNVTIGIHGRGDRYDSRYVVFGIE
jgi:hypothetical protein